MIKYVYQEGQTPIDQDEADSLIPDLSTQDELNQWEQENIISARSWAMQINLEITNILNQNFITKIHQKMFNKSWKWAGKFRTNNKNIGPESYLIPIELKKLIDDTLFWLENSTYTIRQIALLFHHRLVKIHLFSNGNGRHSRLIADLITKKYHGQKINWNNPNYDNHHELRKNYILSLKNADQGNHQKLFEIFDI